jgi:16S rRNA (adenine1518-N6/adenine1519-N6)-dimethyltransferase
VVLARKKFGQHFLEPAWAERLVQAIDPRPADEFLEIGPGPGALTLRLAPLVSQLTAVEIDPAMIAALAPRVPANVTLVQADFLEFDVASAAAGPTRVAGNLPYNVSSPIMFRLLKAYRAGAPLTDATLMLQEEVADRVQARPGTKDYGVLSILVQLHADVQRRLSLPPGAFRPPPKVRSSVVNLRFRPPAVRLGDEAAFESMVRSMFTRRRKMLSNALGSYAAGRGADADAVLEAAGIDHRRRPETLQLEELARLADAFARQDGRAVL